MALKPIDPGPQSAEEEREAFTRAQQDAQEHPERWANGPEHAVRPRAASESQAGPDRSVGQRGAGRS